MDKLRKLHCFRWDMVIYTANGLKDNVYVFKANVHSKDLQNENMFLSQHKILSGKRI